MIRTTPSIKRNSSSSHKDIKVWVLAPCIETADENIDYYYDFTQSIAEYTKVFETLQLPWQWQPVTMQNYASIIDDIEAEKENCLPVILNLCDGDEVNGTPGISVVKLLEDKDLVYTGADEYFYHVTTSKIPMKKAFDKAGVANAAWKHITNKGLNGDLLFRRLGSPIIVKPAVSGGSMGVGVKNVVETKEALNGLLQQMFAGYRGWNLTADGIVAEKFISGPEYTVFISGSYDRPEDAVIYTPVERVFHASLPDKEKFLSFDRLWEIYEEESAMPGEENFYEYRLPAAELIEPVKKISWDAYCATRGKGYTRVDIRMDASTGKLYVLEINAQCGISEDENFTSIGAILRFSGKNFSQLVEEILFDALKRASLKKQSYINNSNNARA
jgi:D-alanine-D-alanine ligase